MSTTRSIRRIAGLAVAVLALAGLAACDGPTVAQGRITVAGTGAHPAGVAVTAYADDTETVVAEVRTDVNGNYRFGDQTLPPGTYRLRFNHDEWWGGTTWATATPVDVSTTAPLTVSPTLTYRTATITGTVADPAGSFVIEAFNVDGGPTLTRNVDDEDQVSPGTQFTVADLPAGTYRFRFTRSYVGSRNVERVYEAGAYTASTAPTHELTPGSSTPGIDTTFPVGSEIVAMITDGTPADFANDTIGSSHLVVSADTLEPMAELTRRMAGVHQATGVPPVQFRILLLDPSGRLRPTFAGEKGDAPLGTAFSTGADVPFTLAMIGRDCTKGDFAPGADHTGRDLAGKVLSSCDLRNSDLTGVDLSGSDLTAADLEGADLTGANLTGTKLPWADLSGAHLNGANLTNAQLTHANLQGADLTDADITGTALGLSDLRGATLTGLDLAGAHLEGVDLSGRDLRAFDLTGTFLGGADLSGSDLRGVALVGATVTYVQLVGSDLAGADLTGAFLQESDLTDADLTNANLTNATVQGIDWTRADLTGATVVGLRYPQWMTFADTTCPDGTLATSPTTCF